MKAKLNKVMKNKISKESYKRVQDPVSNLTSRLAWLTAALEEMQMQNEALEKG